MASEKTAVIDYLFFKYWDPKTKKLRKSVMSMTDVQEAIRHCNEKHGSNLSDRNPANFMKDMIRGQGASRNWPDALKELRFTAVQRPGAGDVFEFISYKPRQTEPFPDSYKPAESTPRFIVQSVSMPLAARELGRSDEPWLIQTAVNLRIVETHFAVVSKQPVAQLTHLQMSVKLRETEIDAIFLAICKTDEAEYRAVVTCEAKQSSERILDHQIINQVRAAFEETQVDVVIPIALRAVRGVGFYVVEFAAVSRSNAQSLEELIRAQEAVYELRPSVPGI
jgi:hypothetical protein